MLFLRYKTGQINQITYEGNVKGIPRLMDEM